MINMKPERLPGESFEKYKERREAQKEVLKQKAKGHLHWDSRRGPFRTTYNGLLNK